MYLGVDGGGTKSAFVLVDSAGDVVATHEEAGSYHLDIGIDGLRGLIETGISQVLAKVKGSPEDIKYAFFGLPAYGEDSALETTLDAVPSGILPGGNYQCDNDMVGAWAGSLACQDGINIVAGTGSIGFGRYRGRSARCGGWGEVFGDEGSAYWIACRGLQTFAKMSDGRLHRGPLYALVREEFSLIQDLDLSALVLNEWSADRAKIAAVSRVVAKAALAGDLDAMAIFMDAAGEIVSIVNSTRRQLNFPKDYEVPVSYSGGVFQVGKLIIGPFTSGLMHSGARYRICQPKFAPAIGAALYAGVLDNCEAIIDKLRACPL